MNDQELRRLEVSFAASGSVPDEAALLGAAMRAGSLLEDRVRVAAHLGHLPAQIALGQEQVEVEPYSAIASELRLLPGCTHYNWEAPLRCR